MLPWIALGFAALAGLLAGLRALLHRNSKGTLVSLRPTLLARAAASQLTRQVFISHTGQDDGAKTFAASILKPALEAAGLKVYMDFTDLAPGCKWPEELVNAAANSTVVVVVLSKSYTQRYWCMLELDLALNSRLQAGSSSRPVIIPVFYDAPKDIVQQREIMLHWSAKQQQLPANRQGWVDAGHWAANIAEMKEQVQNLRNSQGAKDAEWQLARQVVAAAVSKMFKQVPDGGKLVIGFEQQEAHLLSQLDGRLGLWLYGPGGMGKSTMAKRLFNRLSPGFSHSAIVEFGFEDGSSLPTALQLSSALQRLGASVCSDASLAELQGQLQEWVKDQKVLFVVDNVSAASQLDVLLPVQWGEGSVVIVTSRKTGLPDSSCWQQVKSQLFQHPMEKLDDTSAQQLLLGFTNLGSIPPNLEKAAADLIRLCNGLPLALKLAGAGLCDNKTDLKAWQAVLAALCTGRAAADSEGRLKGVLDHSFKGLNNVQQNMFLDVATVVAGQPKDLVMAMWVAWHGPEAPTLYDELIRRCLLGVNEYDCLVTHDVLAALGHGLLLDPCSPHFGSRIWYQNNQLMGAQQGRKVLAAQLDADIAFWRFYSADDSSTNNSVPEVVDFSEARILRAGRQTLGLVLPQQIVWLDVRTPMETIIRTCLASKLVVLTANNQDLAELPE